MTESTKVVNYKASARSFDFPIMLFLAKQASSEHHGLIYSVSQQREESSEHDYMRGKRKLWGEHKELATFRVGLY